MYEPRYGVSDSPSSNFGRGSYRVFAWFNSIEDARIFKAMIDRALVLWDLNEGKIVD